MITIRPSVRPLAHTCPSSILPPDYTVDGPSLARNLGEAAHQCAQLELLGDDYSVGAVAARYDADPVELGEMLPQICGVIAKLRPYLPGPLTEHRVEGPLGGGTMDVWQRLDDCEVVADYKSGWVKIDAKPQLLAYAHALRHSGCPGPYKLIPIHLRYGTYHVHDVGDAELDAFERRDTEIQEQAGKIFAPGDHCGYCRRSHECVPYRDAQRNAAAALVEAQTGEMSNKTLVDLYPRSRMLKKALEAYESMLKAAAGSGPIQGSGGAKIELREAARDEIDPKKAWSLLRGQGFDDTDLRACLAVKKGAVEDIVKGRAARGLKKREADALIAKLRRAGAIVRHPYRRTHYTRPRGDIPAAEDRDNEKPTNPG